MFKTSFSNEVKIFHCLKRVDLNIRLVSIHYTVRYCYELTGDTVLDTRKIFSNIKTVDESNSSYIMSYKLQIQNISILIGKTKIALDSGSTL